MIPGDLLSAFPHRQFPTLPGLLDSWAALPNSNPNACIPMQGGSLYHFYDGLWYDPAEKRTDDLPCERRAHKCIIKANIIFNGKEIECVHDFNLFDIIINEYLQWKAHENNIMIASKMSKLVGILNSSNHIHIITFQLWHINLGIPV